MRLYLRDGVAQSSCRSCANSSNVLCEKAEAHADTVMPGYTHLQRAQPITFAHHLMAYAQMFLRDMRRTARLRQSAYGRHARLAPARLAGTTYPLDREMTAEAARLLRRDRRTASTAYADRDFCAGARRGAFRIVMVHLSRFSEEIILWCSLGV